MKTLTLDSADIDKVLALLAKIEDPYAMVGDPCGDEAWERREFAIADLAELLRSAVMER